MLKIYKCAVVPGLALLAGCSVAGDGLWPDTPDSTAEADRPPGASLAAAPPAWDAPAPPADPLALDLPTPREPVATDSFVGQKVAGLQSDLNLLITMLTAQNGELSAAKGSSAQLARYHRSSVEAIRSRLDAGTAPGNPDLMAQLDWAREALDRMAGVDAGLDELSSRVAGNGQLITYVTESANAARAVEGGTEDDQAKLGAVIDDAARVAAANDRLLGEINATMTRNAALATTERTKLSGLAMAVRNGNAFTATESWMASGGPAIMVIGFDRADSEFEPALQDAVSATLDRQPDAMFELVAVIPRGARSGKQATRSAERVLKSLVNMGLPTDRVILVSETSDLVSEGEVQIYVR